MLYGLDNILRNFVPEERIELLDDGLYAIEQYKLFTVAGQISMLMEGAGQYDPITIMARFSDEIEQGLDSILFSFEILVEGGIKEKTAIVKGLYAIENTEQSDLLVDVIGNAETPNEALLHLLGHFTGKSPEWFFPHLTDASNAFITRLYETHKPIADLATEDVSPVDESVIGRCKKFMEKYNHTFLHDAIYEEQMKPGISDNLLFIKYQDKLSSLYPNALDQLAVEIVGLMAMTNVMNKNFGMSVKLKLNEIIPDKAVAARMVTMVDDVTMRLGIYA